MCKIALPCIVMRSCDNTSIMLLETFFCYIIHTVLLILKNNMYSVDCADFSEQKPEFHSEHIVLVSRRDMMIDVSCPIL